MWYFKDIGWKLIQATRKTPTEVSLAYFPDYARLRTFFSFSFSFELSVLFFFSSSVCIKHIFWSSGAHGFRITLVFTSRLSFDDPSFPLTCASLLAPEERISYALFFTYDWVTSKWFIFSFHVAKWKRFIFPLLYLSPLPSPHSLSIFVKEWTPSPFFKDSLLAVWFWGYFLSLSFPSSIVNRADFIWWCVKERRVRRKKKGINSEIKEQNRVRALLDIPGIIV